MNTERVNIDRLIEYSHGRAEEFLSRLNRIRTFIPHNLTSGTANESILRSFLAELSAGNLKVGQGFICDPISQEVQSSRQCDILVYDQANYPLVHAEGEIVVVWPESVRMIIEVKTNINSRKKLQEAIENVVSGKTVVDNRHTIGIIFAFGAIKYKTILRELREYKGELLNRPLAVLLFDQGIIIEQGQEDITLWDQGGSPYFAKKASSQGSVLTWLILTFFYQQMSWGNSIFHRTDILSAMHQFMKTQMTLLKD